MYKVKRFCFDGDYSDKNDIFRIEDWLNEVASAGYRLERIFRLPDGLAIVVEKDRYSHDQ